MLAAQPLTTFCEATAAVEPTPGGGAVAAAVAALGASVGAMAAGYSVDAEGESEAQAVVDAGLEALGELRRRLLVLVDDDCEAYTAVRTAYALPKADDEQKAARRQAIQDSLAGAAEPPLRICRAAFEGLGALEELVPHANAHLLSDVGVAAHSLNAALHSAWLNVLVNARLIKRAELSEALRSEGQRLVDRGGAVHARVAARVLHAIDS